MLIVRRVQEDDLDQLFELIQKSEYGLTTLKVSKEELASRIEKSIFAFSQKSGKPAGQPYVFVMEDLTKGKVVGTCSIYAKVGGFEPLYSYEIQTSVHASKDLGVHKEIDVLHLRRARWSQRNWQFVFVSRLLGGWLWSAAEHVSISVYRGISGKIRR